MIFLILMRHKSYWSVVEKQGSGLIHGQSNAADIIRRHFYGLNYWHTDIKLADVG